MMASSSQSTSVRLCAKRLQTIWLITSKKTNPIRLITIFITSIIFIFLVIKTIQSTYNFITTSTNKTATTKLLNNTDIDSTTEPIHLFIAIGSAPKNQRLRQTARQTWLKWIPTDQTISYKFFTDAPPPVRTSYATESTLWREIAIESSNYKDIIEQPLPTGYGNNNHNAYGKRALYQAKYAINNYQHMTHMLRIDDDSFLCLHRLIYELKSIPRSQFFWGRFWCKSGRNRADENFMLFTYDLIKLLSDDSITGKLLPFDNDVTLGWNFGYWSWILNISIFDDQKRIDAQQGYLTKYMHADGSNASFCDTYIYAHHVPNHVMKFTYDNVKTHLMYNVPKRKGPQFTCKEDDRSFIPGRHSKHLPNLKFQRVYQ